MYLIFKQTQKRFEPGPHYQHNLCLFIEFPRELLRSFSVGKTKIMQENVCNVDLDCSVNNQQKREKLYLKLRNIALIYKRE